MSTGPEDMQAHSSSGGNPGGSKGDPGGWRNWRALAFAAKFWPLGLAGVIGALTVQSARGIEEEKTYIQLAKGIENGEGNSKNLGGLQSMVHWLHLFGHGPAGQELRRRLAKVGFRFALN